MKLSDTIEMMNSEDFKERFKAEYFQLKIRYQKLHDMVVKYEAGTLPFTPNCPLELLKHQKSLMGAVSVRFGSEGTNRKNMLIIM